MKLTIEISNTQENEKLFELFNTLHHENDNIISNNNPLPNINKGNKKINPKELFGIWRDNPKTIEEIREKSWKRNWDE